MSEISAGLQRSLRWEGWKGSGGWGRQGLPGAWCLDHRRNGCSAQRAHTRTFPPLALPLPLGSRLQSCMLIRLSPSSEWSAHSFVSRITTEEMRAWPFNLFKHLSVCHRRKTALGIKVGRVDAPWWHGTQLARVCPPSPHKKNKTLYLTQNAFRHSYSITVGLDIRTRTGRNLVRFPRPAVNTIFN